MSNLSLRIISAVVLIPPLLALVFLAPPWLFSSVIVFLAALSGFEYGSITLGARFKRYQSFIALLAAICAGAVAWWPFFNWAPFAAVALVVMVCPISFILGKAELKHAVPAAASCAVGALYTGFLTGFIALIYSTHNDGSFWVITLLLGTFIGDTSAYAAGRLFGKRKLAPRVSPGKTWAGAVGGLLGTCAAITISKLFLITSLTWPEVFILAVPLSVACQVGDLAESFLKRGFGVKDSGRIIPGHGGILDRIDALMFGAPVLFLFSVLR